MIRLVTIYPRHLRIVYFFSWCLLNTFIRVHSCLRVHVVVPTFNSAYMLAGECAREFVHRRACLHI